MIRNASAAKMPEVLVEGQLADSSWGTTTAQRYQHLKELVEQGAHEPNPVKVWLWSNYNEAAGVNAEWENANVTYGSGSSYAKNSLQNPDLREAWLNLVESKGHGMTGGEVLSRSEEADEFLMMGLRLVEGIDLTRYEALSGHMLSTRRMAILQEEGLIAPVGNSGLRATAAGMVVLDALVADLAR